MRIEWTEQGKRGWREVAAYVKRDFGLQGLQLFKQRTKDNEKFISNYPEGCEEVWTDPETGIVYRGCVVYKRSKMLYFVQDEKIFIADFWDVRSNH